MTSASKTPAAVAPPLSPTPPAKTTTLPPATVKLPMYVSMFNSCFAGCLGWLYTHPFEILKNKVILSSSKDTFKSCIDETWKGGIFKGLTGGLARQVTYTTFRLSFYDPIKGLIVKPDTEPMVIQRAAAGALSGCAASFLASPVEVCLVLQTKSTTKLSLLEAGKGIWARSGFTGFWRGAVPLMVRATVVGISQVAMYDQVRSMIEKFSRNREAAGGTPLTRNTIVVSSGVMTSVFYSFVTMPIELARVRMSAFKGADKPPNMIAVIGNVAKTEGVSFIFKAFIPYLLRSSVHTTSIFFILDYMNRLTHKYYDKK